MHIVSHAKLCCTSFARQQCQLKIELSHKNMVEDRNLQFRPRRRNLLPNSAHHSTSLQTPTTNWNKKRATGGTQMSKVGTSQKRTEKEALGCTDWSVKAACNQNISERAADMRCAIHLHITKLQHKKRRAYLMMRIVTHASSSAQEGGIRCPIEPIFQCHHKLLARTRPHASFGCGCVRTQRESPPGSISEVSWGLDRHPRVCTCARTS